MRTKVIAGLMILSPIIGVIMWTVVMPSFSDMSLSQQLDEMAANEGRFMTAGLLGTLAMIGLILGLALFARSLRDGDDLGTICAEISGILLFLIIPIFIITAGHNWGAMQEIDKAGGRDLAEVMLGNAEGAFGMAGVIWGIATLMLGIAMVLRKKFHIALGYIVVILASLMIIGELTEDAVEAIGGIGWMGMFVSSIVLGILSVVRKEA